MTKTTSKQLKVKTTVKAGGHSENHNRTALKFRSADKTGGVKLNHDRSAL